MQAQDLIKELEKHPPDIEVCVSVKIENRQVIKDITSAQQDYYINCNYESTPYIQLKY